MRAGGRDRPSRRLPAPIALPGAASPWVLRRLMAILVLLSGLLLGLAAPGRDVPYAWLLLFAPLFLALDLALRGASRRGRWLRALACTWPVGVLFAAVTGDWVVNTAYVFGGMPKALAYAASLLGYGTLMGLEVFFFLGVPFALGWGRRLQAPLVVLWATVFQAYLPRFLYWSYGQAMFPVPALLQATDLVGTAGLNLWLLPLHWLVFAWVRRTYAPEDSPRRALWQATAALLAAFALSYGYGAWRMERVAAGQANGAAVHLVGVQPDISLKDLASNPDLSPSSRRRTLSGLLADSSAALAQGVVPGAPTVVIWPESVYPAPYFDSPNAREVVETWARDLGIHVIVATIDTRRPVPRPGDGRARVHGAAVHVPPGGAPRVYHKLTPIPFGETVPFGDVFPWYRDTLLALVPNMSDFARGREFTVFDIAPGVRIAPLICFDATDDSPVLGMVGNGATLGVVMANLAWFGRTSASAQFELYVRQRAIEARIPILLLSQNGESVLIDARGLPASPRLPLFEPGVLSLEVRGGPADSFFAAHARWVYGAYALLLAGVLAWEFGRGAWRGRP